MEFSVFLVSSSGEKLNVLSKFGMLQPAPIRQISRLQEENLINATINTIISEMKTYGKAKLKFPMYDEII
jgi:hypothetical protein